MKRYLVALIVLLVPCLGGQGRCRTWVVELDGSGDFTVIQDAVDAAADGDTIFIGPGHHTAWFRSVSTALMTPWSMHIGRMIDLLPFWDQVRTRWFLVRIHGVGFCMAIWASCVLEMPRFLFVVLQSRIVTLEFSLVRGLNFPIAYYLEGMAGAWPMGRPGFLIAGS